MSLDGHFISAYFTVSRVSAFTFLGCNRSPFPAVLIVLWYCFGRSMESRGEGVPSLVQRLGVKTGDSQLEGYHCDVTKWVYCVENVFEDDTWFRV